jgi:MFS family permease
MEDTKERNAGLRASLNNKLEPVAASGEPPPLVPWYHSSTSLMVNFITVAICFSLNHGCVTAVLALSSALIGKELAGTQTGVLYVMYTLSALTVASGLVQATGPKTALTVGLFLYCFYVGSFIIAANADPGGWLQYLSACVGAGIGGFAAGWLWTAQGAFFARTSQFYAESKKLDPKASSSYLAATFATFYVGCEVILKFISSWLRDDADGNLRLFTAYTIIAAAAAVCMSFIREVPIENPPAPGPLFSVKKITLALNLWAIDSRMAFLTPINIAFGFTTAYINNYVNTFLDTPGSDRKATPGWSGLVLAVTPATATLLSFPYSFLSAKYGKLALMVWGGLNYAAASVWVLILSPDDLVGLGFGIMGIYAVVGSGRAVFEGTNKALFADFFPEDKEAAFANVIVQSGGGAALAYFVFPMLEHEVIGYITAGMALLGIICLVLAFRENRRLTYNRIGNDLA